MRPVTLLQLICVEAQVALLAQEEDMGEVMLGSQVVVEGLVAMAVDHLVSVEVIVVLVE